MKRCCWTPPPRRCYELSPTHHSVSARGRARADAQGRCDGAGSEEIGSTRPPAPDRRRGFVVFGFLAPISLVESRSEGLGHSNAKIARRAFQILRSVCPPTKMRISPENSLRTSRGKIVIRYNKRAVESSSSTYKMTQSRKLAGCEGPSTILSQPLSRPSRGIERSSLEFRIGASPLDA